MPPQERTEVHDGIKHERYRLLFLSPERLITSGFMEVVSHMNVQAFAIDEAHCISHWGHDFRPEYRQLSTLKKRFPGASVHAFTAKRAKGTPRLVLTNSTQDVVGATITLDTPGVYVVMAVFDFDGNTGDGIGVGSLYVDGVVQNGQALAALPATDRITAPQNWIVTKTTLGPTVLKLRGHISGATAGTPTISTTHTTILAFTVPGSQDLSALARSGVV